MAVKFAGWGNHQFVIPTTGAPASGYKLYTYVAGSSTLVTTYTTSAGSVAQSNPIILNSAGFPTTGQIWITEGTSIKIVFTDASDVVIKTEDNIPGLNDTVSQSDEWVSGPAPTFISTTSFSLVGDQTSTFQVGRRVKTTNSGGTIYSRISASVYAALTTVTVINDSGVLDSGLSAVSYASISVTNPSIDVLAVKRLGYPVGTSGAAIGLLNTDNTQSGTLTMSGKPIIQAEGAAVASAGTCDIWTPADGDTVHVTGTTTITSFGTAPQAGAYKRVIFDGALTLTHGANLNLPGAANITTAANDSCLVYADTTTQLDVVSYTKANGKAVVASGAWSPVETKTLSANGSDQTFTGLSPGVPYRLEISVYKSASNRCNLRFGNSGGVDSGANYSYTGTSKDLTPTITDFALSGQTSVVLVGGAPAGAHSEKIVLEFETDVNDNTHVWGFNKGIQNSSFIGIELYINYNGASAFDRVSILIGAGTWTGTMRLLRLN